MARKFYTEDDIEDMVKSGVTSLEINDCVTLTELAYEKAKRLGLTLIQADAEESERTNPAVFIPTTRQCCQSDGTETLQLSGGMPKSETGNQR